MNYKSTILLVSITFGLLAFAMEPIEIEVNLDEAFTKMAEVTNLELSSKSVKTLLKGDIQDPITFGTCVGAHPQIFRIFDAACFSEPKFATKGATVGFNYVGVMNENVNLDQLHYEIYYFDELYLASDLQTSAVVGKGQQFKFTFNYPIPDYTPSGNFTFDVTFKAGGQELGCERANFTLSD
ncbi:unnamed protein product [Moneuplotes crassus]|uniref:Uncharacterized protein n=1 Tax=Euplotes crassus TaxID=5936 RepID=A0AAD1XZU8_EUPCR|nr:unnamed protein product [Moneuplotes crassus]